MPERFVADNGDEATDVRVWFLVQDGRTFVERVEIVPLEPIDTDALVDASPWPDPLPTLPGQPIPLEHFATWPRMDKVLAGALRFFLEHNLRRRHLWARHEAGLRYGDGDVHTELGKIDQKARQVAAAARKRQRLDPDFLREVAQLEAEGGWKAVQAVHPVEERTIRRWLQRATEAGLR